MQSPNSSLRKTPQQATKNRHGCIWDEDTSPEQSEVLGGISPPEAFKLPRGADDLGADHQPSSTPVSHPQGPQARWGREKRLLFPNASRRKGRVSRQLPLNLSPSQAGLEPGR